MASEIGLSISEGREPGTISIRMSKLDGSGETMEWIGDPGIASWQMKNLAEAIHRSLQPVRVYPLSVDSEA